VQAQLVRARLGKWALETQAWRSVPVPRIQLGPWDEREFILILSLKASNAGEALVLASRVFTWRRPRPYVCEVEFPPGYLRNRWSWRPRGLTLERPLP
jgi:hypothetical protein